jgi:hypothetical protein
MKSFIKLFFTIALVGSFSIMNAQDHQISVAGQLGYAIPGGAGVGEGADAAYDVDGGLVYQGDILYHLMDEKLRVGVAYSGAILASVDGNFDAYGMTIYGLKGLYYLKSEGFSPFGGLSLGLMTLSTPEFTDGSGQVINPAEKGSTIAIQPTLGLAFGGFYISADYVLPGNIKLKDDALNREGKIGYLGINLGYRYIFDL